MNSRRRNRRFSCERSKGDEQQSQKYQNNIAGTSKTDVCVIPAANEHKFLLFPSDYCAWIIPNVAEPAFRTIPILDLNLLLFGFSHPHLCWCLWLCCCLNVAPHVRDMTLKSRRIQKASWQEANAADRKWQTRIPYDSAPLCSQKTLHLLM